MEFISWITSSKIAIPHTILGGQSPNISAYQSYDLAMLYPWLSSSLRELKRGRKRQSPRTVDGKILSEKAFENEIFTAVFSLLERAVAGDTIRRNEIRSVLEKLQKHLMGMSG